MKHTSKYQKLSLLYFTDSWSTFLEIKKEEKDREIIISFHSLILKNT